MEALSSFVPGSFEPPLRLVAAQFVLEPLGPRHNASDHAAWMSSIEHIRTTPGYQGRSWPSAMSLAQNLRDIEMHARHFEERSGFTYTVLERDSSDVIGCVYVYPPDVGDVEHEASVRSWVRVDRADLDGPLRVVVREWLEHDWPFERIAYCE